MSALIRCHECGAPDLVRAFVHGDEGPGRVYCDSCAGCDPMHRYGLCDACYAETIGTHEDADAIIHIARAAAIDAELERLGDEAARLTNTLLELAAARAGLPEGSRS